MGKLDIIATTLQDVYIIKPHIIEDARGYFMEAYNKKDMQEIGLDRNFVQDNESKSQKGVLRGLHFQTKYPQGKLVRVLAGEVFDVAVDLRKGSPTYGKWEGFFLNTENKCQLYIPEGFAHGFLVLSEQAVFYYKCTQFYHPEYDSGLLWNDLDINIHWPLAQIKEIKLSKKDENNKRWVEFDSPFVYGECET